MCQVGESDRLSLGGDDADLKFADDFRELAVTNFNEGRELLFEVKRILKDYGSRVLRDQVNEALGEPHFGKSMRATGQLPMDDQFQALKKSPPFPRAQSRLTTVGRGLCS